MDLNQYKEKIEKESTVTIIDNGKCVAPTFKIDVSLATLGELVREARDKPDELMEGAKYIVKSNIYINGYCEDTGLSYLGDDFKNIESLMKSMYLSDNIIEEIIKVLETKENMEPLLEAGDTIEVTYLETEEVAGKNYLEFNRIDCKDMSGICEMSDFKYNLFELKR